MAHAGAREAAARPGLLAPSDFAPCLASGPGLRSPRSSLLSTQQNKLFPGNVVPLEKMFSHALELLSLTQAAAISPSGPGPTLNNHSF